MVSHRPPFQGVLFQYLPGSHFSSDKGFAAILSVLEGSESEVPKDELRGAAHYYQAVAQPPLHIGPGIQATGSLLAGCHPNRGRPGAFLNSRRHFV